VKLFLESPGVGDVQDVEIKTGLCTLRNETVRRMALHARGSQCVSGGRLFCTRAVLSSVRGLGASGADVKSVVIGVVATKRVLEVTANGATIEQDKNTVDTSCHDTVGRVPCEGGIALDDPVGVTA
jgi:hypothetical protein